MSASIRLTIDLAAIVDNWRSLSERAFPAECAAVVKADAYGLGMPRVVQALAAAGCRSFFVAYLEEGLDLLDVAHGANVYVLSSIPLGDEKAALSAGLIPVVNNLADLRRFKAAAGRAKPPLALHLDTGIHRLGLNETELTTLREHRDMLSGIEIKLIMTHLVTAETPAHPLNRRQRERFIKGLGGLPTAITSMAASSGIFLDSSYHFDMVRAGAALFGINPIPYAPNPMKPAISLEARVLQINDVAAGETVGYGADFVVQHPSRIATLSIGYADGIPRVLSNRGNVHIGGQLCPIVGRVSMDLMTIDVTGLKEGMLKTDDFVEIIGPNHSLDEVAAEAETIGYELLTRLGCRASRHYLAAE